MKSKERSGAPPVQAFRAMCGKIYSMGKHEKLLLRIMSGTSDSNIRFSDLLDVLKTLKFDKRIKGSHNIFSKDGIAEIINLQPLADGKAKPYQVKQVRNILLKYKLHKEV